MARIVVIDDDLAMDLLTEALLFRGHEAFRVSSVTDALRDMDTMAEADLIILDIILPWPDECSDTTIIGDRTAGMHLLQEIRKKRSDLPVIAYSATQDAHVIEAINDDPYTEFISKWDRFSMRELISRFHRALGLPDLNERPHVFIVHGRNDKNKLEVKNYLQNTLGFPEPTILHEQPNMGRTIIEKIEAYAATTSVVAVLLTPDDTVANQ